ncbi:MAG: ChaN family lipoprotein, partial [Pseudomonadota bacterium]
DWLAQKLTSSDQSAREAEMIEAHCNKLPNAMAAGMVEIQRLRDAAFATAVLRARDQSGGPIVLITGSGHARIDHGVPAALRAAAPDLSIISLGQKEASDPALAPDVGEPFDFLLTTAPVDRPDPCDEIPDKSNDG